MKTQNDLRQCDVFDNTVLKGLQELKPVNLNVALSERSFCVVITQDCDIVHTPPEDEPFIEFIIGNLSEDKSCKNGKNPRKLHLENNGQILEFIIHNRFFVKKDSLSRFDFSNIFLELTVDNKKILKKWLGNRYTRAAFPDEFNNRLAKAKVAKLTEKGISSKVSHIFFEVADKELSAEENYQLNVMVVVDDSEGAEKDKIEDVYFEVFDNIEGIESNLRVVTEDEVTLNALHNYKRWDKDSISFSKQNQSLPINEIDKLV